MTRTPLELFNVINESTAESLIEQPDRYEFCDRQVTVQRYGGEWYVYVKGIDYLSRETGGRETRGGFSSLAQALEVALNPMNHERWGL